MPQNYNSTTAANSLPQRLGSTAPADPIGVARGVPGTTTANTNRNP